MHYGTIEFRICDTQRSIRKLEMLTALSQALVYQSVLDYHNKNLVELFNMEYLYDGLWKAARFPLTVKMIDPVQGNLSTLNDQINIMVDYAYDALKYFNNLHIVKRVNKISVNGTEADEQVAIYNQSGFQDLKKYLINATEYKIN